LASGAAPGDAFNEARKAMTDVMGNAKDLSGGLSDMELFLAIAGGVGVGVLTGGAGGSIFGPVGTGVGAAVGGITGGLTAATFLEPDNPTLIPSFVAGESARTYIPDVPVLGDLPARAAGLAAEVVLDPATLSGGGVVGRGVLANLLGRGEISFARYLELVSLGAGGAVVAQDIAGEGIVQGLGGAFLTAGAFGLAHGKLDARSTKLRTQAQREAFETVQTHLGIKPKVDTAREILPGLLSKYTPDQSLPGVGRTIGEQLIFTTRETRLILNRIKSAAGPTGAWDVGIFRKGAGSVFEKSKGSDVEALVNAGKVIDDLQLNNPGIVFHAIATTVDRAEAYMKVGFRRGGRLPPGSVKGEVSLILDTPIADGRFHLHRSQWPENRPRVAGSIIPDEAPLDPEIAKLIAPPEQLSTKVVDINSQIQRMRGYGRRTETVANRNAWVAEWSNGSADWWVYRSPTGHPLVRPTVGTTVSLDANQMLVYGTHADVTEALKWVDPLPLYGRSFEGRARGVQDDLPPGAQGIMHAGDDAIDPGV